MENNDRKLYITHRGVIQTKFELPKDGFFSKQSK